MNPAEDPHRVNRIKALLVEIERRAERVGWDEPAVFYLLYDERNPTTVREYRNGFRRHGLAVAVHPYAAQPALDPDVLAGGDLASNLYELAARLSAPRPPTSHATWLMLARQPGFVGVAFCCEGYGIDMTPEQAEAYTRGAAPRIGDTVGAREYRNVTAADVAGHDYAVQRWRGRYPTVHHIDPQHPPEPAGDGSVLVELDGSVQISLRRLTAVIARLPYDPDMPLPMRHPAAAGAPAGLAGIDHVMPPAGPDPA